jgi:hypothetical protein
MLAGAGVGWAIAGAAASKTTSPGSKRMARGYACSGRGSSDCCGLAARDEDHVAVRHVPAAALTSPAPAGLADMKLVVGLVVLLASATAFAGPPGETAPVDPAADATPDRGRWKERIKARFDTDHDGVLSPEEKWVAKQAIRRHRMKQRMAQGGDKRARRFDRVIQRFDRNGDGVLGPGEVPPRLVHKLRRLDRNGDGWLTRDEVVRRRPQRLRRGAP